MSRRKLYSSTFTLFIFIIVILPLSFPQFGSVRFVQCQADDFTPPQLQNPSYNDYITRAVYDRLSNLTSVILTSEIVQDSSFCIADPEAEWNTAFNYSTNLDFLSACLAKNRDITRRFCTAAEIKFYFSNLMSDGRHLKPNKNCNLSSWLSGCEPGWACSTDSEEPVDLKNSQEIPGRGSDCQSCCEGFFCPRGITCMIPCPLGSYCPSATLNNSTGTCEPYAYQLPVTNPDHTCGGADIWTDIRTSSDVFCSAGSYCPATTHRIPCSSGY